MSQISENNRRVIVSQESLTEDSEAILFSNVNVVNSMFAEHIQVQEIPQDALRSYYVDFYTSQLAAGGFAHFVYISGMDEDLLQYIKEGLEGMGATGHLALFRRFLSTFENLDDDAQEYFLSEQDFEEDVEDRDVEDDYSDDDEERDAEQSQAYSSGRRLMDSDDDDFSEEYDEQENVEPTSIYEEELDDVYEDAFDDLDDDYAELNDEADLVELNAAWLKAHPDLTPLPAGAIDERIESMANEIPDIDDRRRVAEQEELEGMPEHEQIIVELADVADHDLEEILDRDPEFEWEGEPQPAWRFVTNEGEFVMIDDLDRALMVDPRTQEVIAEIEFADDSAVEDQETDQKEPAQS